MTATLVARKRIRRFMAWYPEGVEGLPGGYGDFRGQIQALRVQILHNGHVGLAAVAPGQVDPVAGVEERELAQVEMHALRHQDLAEARAPREGGDLGSRHAPEEHLALAGARPDLPQRRADEVGEPDAPAILLADAEVV